MSEPLEKILRYGQSLDYFDPAALGTSVIYEDLGQTLNDEGLPGVLARITELLKQRRPGLMVIDSFKALRAYAADAGAFRRFLHDLAGRLSALPVTSFWVGEYDQHRRQRRARIRRRRRDPVAGHRPHRRTGKAGAAGPQAPRQRLLDRQARLPALPRGLDVFPRLADPVDTDRLRRHPGTDVVRRRGAGRHARPTATGAAPRP